jgi:hypothetical protein
MYRVALTSAFGETAFVWAGGLGMFVVFLLPILIAEYLLQRNPRLRCPQCGHLLTYIRTMRWVTKHDECLFCGMKLNVQKPTRREFAIHAAFILGSIALLILFFELLH